MKGVQIFTRKTHFRLSDVFYDVRKLLWVVNTIQMWFTLCVWRLGHGWSLFIVPKNIVMETIFFCIFMGIRFRIFAMEVLE